MVQGPHRSPAVEFTRVVQRPRALGITRLSKSPVSAMAADLDGQVEAFRTRPLNAGAFRPPGIRWRPLHVRGSRCPGPDGPRGRTRGQRPCPGRGRGEQGRSSRILGLQVTPLRTGPAGVLPEPDRPRPDRRPVGDLGRPYRPGRGGRSHHSRGILAAVPHALCGELDGRHRENVVAVNEDTPALGLRPARRRRCSRPVRPGSGDARAPADHDRRRHPPPLVVELASLPQARGTDLFIAGTCPIVTELRHQRGDHPKATGQD